MNIEKSYHRNAFFFIAACYALIIAQFWLIRSDWNAQEHWVTQFHLLIAFSFILSLLQFLLRAHWHSRFLFILKAVVFILFTNILFVLGYGAGNQWGLETSFMVLLTVEISSCFNLGPSVLLTCIIIGLTALSVLVTRAVDSSFPRVSWSDMLALAAITTIAGVAANVIHSVVRSLDRQVQMNERLDKAVSQLIDANIDFQNYATTAGEESAHQERKQITRDIHDTAVHSLITIIMLAESINDKIASDQVEVAGMLNMIISQAKDAAKETRQSLRELRNMEDESPRGLKAIQRLIKVFSEATGVEVSIAYGNLPWEFNREIDEALYRMIQEGLTNSFRHGKATKVTISLWIVRGDREREIMVSISDNGQGSQEMKKGIGLQGMEERIQKLQGSLEAKNIAGGFSISARIPLKYEEDGEQDENQDHYRG
jgi:signal transduction histidine kinase